MKRKLSFLTLLLIFCSTMFGQSHWTVNENTYNSTMNVTTYAEIYGELQNGASAASLEIAAFCGNEVRGVANIEYDPINLDYSAWMTIHGDTPNEIITFKLYDHSTNTEYTTDYTLRYRLNDVIGDDEQPITIDFVEYHWEFVKDNETMPYSMTIMSTASIDDILLNRRNFDVAAFYGDELRGVGRQQKDGIIYFAIWGDGTETEDITFKLYDHSDGTLYERTDYSVPFEINNILGDIANPVNINFTTRPYVAQIGDVKYISLAEAFEAAQNGDVVEILMAGTYELATSGKNITITGAVDGVVFDNIGAKNMGGANVTFNNVTFDYYPNVNYTGLQHSGNLVYNNCTINGQVFLYGTSETFSKCTFNQNSADAYNVWTYGAKDVDFIECTFNSVGKSVLIYNESESVTNDVTVTDCDFIASAPVDGKAAIEMDSSLQGEIKLTVDAATTVTGFGTGNVSGNSLWNNKKGNETEANNDITVIVNGETVLAPLPLVAMTADDKNHRFTSLQAAYDAVAADGTITILNSVEGPGLVINKNVTIDFAGYTYTFNDGVGSTGTESNGFQIYAGNTVTLKNGTLNVAQSAASKFYTIIQNYANLTVEDMTLDGTNLDKWSTSDGDSYVLSNNSGIVEIKGATEIIANNEGDKAFAFDVCKYASYAAPVVNVTGAEVKVNGAIEVHQDIPNNLNISAGTFTKEIEEAWCAEGYIPTQNTDGTWTVKAGKYVAQINDGAKYESLAEALTAAQDGNTVNLLADMANIGSVTFSKSLTINGNGHTISGESRIVVACGHNTVTGVSPTFNNIIFKDITPNKSWSAIVVNHLDAKLTVNGCTFDNVEWDAIQVASNKTNAEVSIINNTFRNGGKRYIHVQPTTDTKAEMDITVTGNKFYGENTTSIGIWYPTQTSTLNIEKNYVQYPSTISISLLDEENNIVNNSEKALPLYNEPLTEEIRIEAVVKEGLYDAYFYAKFAEAIVKANDGAIINVLPLEITDYIVRNVDNETASLTILGASEWMGEGEVTTLKGGMYLGYNNSQCDPNTIVVKGITFEGKGLKIASQENVTVENNIFNNITDDIAIAVIGKDIKAVAKNNTITNAAEIGIELRNMAEATITNNVVKNTGHNSVQATAVNADADVTITGNTFENWGTATNAQGQYEGRAVRVSGGANVVVNNNKMINANAPESFVKITKVNGQTAQEIDVDKNYWNGDNPLALFETDGTNDPVSYIKGYYSDANLTNYIQLTASVAKIGTTYYQTLQAAVDACVVGDNTIEMLAEINEDVTIKQVEGVNVVIEGADNTFTGTFYIHGNARLDGAETLTFQNINFTTNEAGHYFIDSNSTASTERYAHNVTVKNCDFTATEAGVNSAAAMRIRQGFDIAINGGTFNYLHSVLQAYGNAGITVDGITVNGKNGISAGTSTGVVVKNTNITATGYGVRADGTGAYDVTIKGTTTINAAMPVVVRKTNDGNGYNLTIADGVTLTTTGSGYQVTFTAGDDGEYVAPTAGATANFGNNSYTTFGLVAKIENEYYTTVDYAAAYATTTEGTQTIVLIDDAAAATNPLNVEVIDLNGKTLTADVLGTVVTNGGLWTTAAAPGYKMLGVGAEIYATAGATVINSQTEVNIVEGDVTLVPAEWWTLQGQSLIIGEHASFTIPTGSKFNVMNNTDVTINGTAINNGTLAIHPEATVNGNVAGNLQFLGGSYVTAEDHKMVGTTDDYHYNTTDALVNIALNGDITIAAGTMTLGHDWRTLPNQTVTVASAAAFIVPSNMTYQIYGTAVVEDGGTLTVNGTIELASLTATLTAEDGLNVTLIDELQNQGYDVDYSNGTYSVIEGMIWNKTQDKKYNSLQAAIDASSEGDEIVVLKDINVGKDNTVLVDGYNTFFKLSGNKAVTIELNGKDIIGDVTGVDNKGGFGLVALLSICEGGQLTINDAVGTSDVKIANADINGNENVYSLISCYDNGNGSKLTINGGNYYLNKAVDCLIHSAGDEAVTVNGGTFTLVNVGEEGPSQNYNPWIFNVNGGNAGNVTVNGGTYNSDINHLFWANEVYIPETLALKYNGDEAGTWTVVESVAYAVEKATSTNASARKVGYATLAEAVNPLGNPVDNTVTVIKAHETTVPAIVERDMTIDFASLAITGNVYPVVRIQNDANVTVKNGNITNNDYVFVLGASDGSSAANLTIESGVYTGTTTVASVTKGLLTINGGEFKVNDSEYGATYMINCIDANYNDDSANVEIYGGKFYGFNPENNAAEGAGTNFCAQGYGAIENTPNVWTVIPKQTMTAEVKKGWNWFSYYVEGDVLDQLQNSLGQAGVQIKSRTAFTQYSNGDWNGDLVSTTPAESYKINVNADAVVNVTGNIVNPSTCYIMLNNGGTGNGAWNWIGYPLAQETSVATAFAGVVKNGDEVKTRTGFAEYVNGQWWGSLMTLKPGVGYMYFRAGANETVSNFTYPTPSSKEAVQPNITADANLWVPNSTSYANNMTMVAVLNMNGEMMNDNYEVAAMVNGEVRGSARPIYVEPMDAYMLFLTIHGEGVEEVTFQCYDFNTDTEYVLNNTINYSDDARLGSVNEPYVLCYGTMGIGENSIDNINIYPNPTTTDREINLQATCDKVEVFNALGVKVAEYHNVDTLDAIETAGIYVIRVTNDGDVKHCRLVVK